MAHLEFRFNEQIKANQVRLIFDVAGSYTSICSIDEALRIARERGTDLIEVSSNAVPPVCKMMDVGKYKYELSKKKDKQNKINRKQSQIKEVLLRPNIGAADFDTKMKQLAQFIEAGYKVKLVLRFKGRELKFRDIGLGVLEQAKVFASSVVKTKIIQETNSDRMVTCTLVGV